MKGISPISKLQAIYSSRCEIFLLYGPICPLFSYPTPLAQLAQVRRSLALSVSVLSFKAALKHRWNPIAQVSRPENTWTPR